MSTPTPMWIVQLIPRGHGQGGHRIGIYDNEDAAIERAREAEHEYDRGSWQVVIDQQDWYLDDDEDS